MSGLTSVEHLSGTRSNWDWKSSQVERLKTGDSIDYFSQGSVTPDTTLLLAGPPRMNEGFIEQLSPIGLVTDLSFWADNQLRPMWEIGTDVTYFTRGKATYQLQIGAMVANKPSLMKLFTRASPAPDADYPLITEQSGQFWANLDTDVGSSPFGLLMIFKTKGMSSSEAADRAEEDAAVKMLEEDQYAEDMRVYEELYEVYKEKHKIWYSDWIKWEGDENVAYQDAQDNFRKVKAEADPAYGAILWGDGSEWGYDESIWKPNPYADTEPERPVKPGDLELSVNDTASIDSNGDFVGGLYLENCNIGSFNFAINSSSVSIQENVSIMFDRAISVDYGDEDYRDPGEVEKEKIAEATAEADAAEAEEEAFEKELAKDEIEDEDSIYDELF